MTTHQILVVDDDEAIAWTMARILAASDRKITNAPSAEEALKRAHEIPFDLVFLDIRLPGQDGLAILQALKSLTNNAPIVVMTGHGTLQTAVKAVEEGAFDYLTKPFDLDQALACADRALARRRTAPLFTANSIPAAELPELTGTCPLMQEVFKRIALASVSSATVMITGESGTGKELVARAIHRHGPRKNEPFVPVHVAALNPNLVESELFGHEKGAFTNATHASQGLLSLAGKGTLFLDEIAEIPLPVQVKLLRVLEQGTFHAVGSTRELRLEARVLAATHQDLVQRCAENQFRQDLLFRLNVFGIHLPPLRDRGADIKILAESIATSIDARCPPLSEATLQALTSRMWTGNVRELRNALEHAVILARGGPILPGHLPPPVKAEIGSADSLRRAVHQWLDQAIGSEPEPRDLWERFVGATEPAIIEEVLRRVGGNRLHAAQWLGINRSTLRRKLADGESHPT